MTRGRSIRDTAFRSPSAASAAVARKGAGA
jgi:hypothetical protein